MYDFIVLGIIPGTNIQITFQLWLVLLETVFGISLLSFSLMKLHKMHQMSPVKIPVNNALPSPAAIQEFVNNLPRYDYAVRFNSPAAASFDHRAVTLPKDIVARY